MNEMEYLIKNVIKANKELTRLAYKDRRNKSFVDLDELEFKLYENKETTTNAYYMSSENTVYVNKANFSCFDKKKKYCDRELLKTLQHEMIHCWIDEWIDKMSSYTYVVNFRDDDSFCFSLIVRWFNQYGLGIRVNKKYCHRDDEIANKDIVAAIENGCSFIKLYRMLMQKTKEMDNVLIETNKKLVRLYTEHKIDSAYVVSYNYNQNKKQEIDGTVDNVIIGEMEYNSINFHPEQINSVEFLQEDVCNLIDVCRSVYEEKEPVITKELTDEDYEDGFYMLEWNKREL